MKTLYIDCSMGAAGDMLTAALAEATGDIKAVETELNGLGIPGVTFEVEKVQKMGIGATSVHVLVNGEEEKTEDVHEGHDHHHGHEHEHEHDHEHDHQHDHEHDHDHHHDHDHAAEHMHSHEHTHTHSHDHDHDHDHDHGHEHEHDHDHDHDHGHGHHHHSSMADIEKIIKGTSAPEKVKEDAINIYKIIAEAESKVHGESVSEIHFHEVGAMDAVADITACCYLMNRIGADHIVASPVRTGKGHVHCAHGILPVPAPATANILIGMPNFAGDLDGEMCTPTGAAVIKYFAQDFGD